MLARSSGTQIPPDKRLKVPKPSTSSATTREPDLPTSALSGLIVATISKESAAGITAWYEALLLSVPPICISAPVLGPVSAKAGGCAACEAAEAIPRATPLAIALSFILVTFMCSPVRNNVN